MDFCLTDFRGIIGCLIVNIFCDIVVPIAHGSRCETDWCLSPLAVSLSPCWTYSSFSCWKLHEMSNTGLIFWIELSRSALTRTNESLTCLFTSKLTVDLVFLLFPITGMPLHGVAVWHRQLFSWLFLDGCWLMPLLADWTNICDCRFLFWLAFQLLALAAYHMARRCIWFETETLRF